MVKDSEAEDEAEDKGPTVHTDATDAASWATSESTVLRQIKHHSEAEEVEEEADTIPPPT